MAKSYIKMLLSVLAAVVIFIASTVKAYALCPVCTVAVGAGLGLSRFFGIDDAISGVWIGGFTLSMSLWMIEWLKKRYPKFQKTSYQVSTIVLMYLLVVVPLWYSKMIGLPYNTLYGIDKVALGIIFGTAAFFGGFWADRKVRETKGKQLFVYQKVVFPVVSVTIVSTLVSFLV